MTIEFILPDIGEGIVECELLEWLVTEGECITEDQPVAEVMTDKATVQIPAMYAGKVVKLHYTVGDIAKVHAPLFSLEPEASANSQTESDKATPTTKSLSTISSHTANQIEDFILPDIGEGIVECEIVKWHVSEGDRVVEDQVVVEVMTDKAVVEIPAKHAGSVHKLYYAQGDIAKVHAPLFSLAVDDSSVRSGGAECQIESDSTGLSIATSPQTDFSQVHEGERTCSEGEFEPPVIIEGRVLASPAVRRIAREHSITLTNLKGSGKKGRILKSDVLSLVTTSDSALYTKGNDAKHANVISTDPAGNSGVEVLRVEKVRGIQAVMAKQMSASVNSIPHFTVSDELEMDNLIILRERLKPDFETRNIKLSFMPFFIKALSLALNEFPIINSQLNDDVTALTYFKDHNIGFAVDSSIGLLVPNIKNVQRLSLLDIADQMQNIINQARDGKVASEHLKGGTISISNIGAIGGITATPVINKPEAAIVALGKTQKLPRFDTEGNVVAKQIMHVNWSGDHRIIDGATMVRFNNLWMRYLASPEQMLMHLK